MIAASKAVDRTRIAGATGSDVVQAVVDIIGQKCIFKNDRLFVRRMAYVESEDGRDRSTFQPGFFGGIWRISKMKYEATKLCNGALVKFCDDIRTHFNIEWRKTTWKDLLKPFYSGLAAYLSLALNGQDVPGDPVKQEATWRKVFHPKNVLKYTRDFSEAAKSLSTHCDGVADVAFLLDESGSVGAGNFVKVKNFLVKTVQQLKIGPMNIRISLVKFGSSITTVSHLNSHKTSADVINAINKLTYRGGGTPTDEGINRVTNDIFSLKNGGKETKDAPRILVLVTDGQSNNKQRTVAAAAKAKLNKIDIFSVGVGSGIDNNELRQVANRCDHVFTVNTFDDFDNFISELTKETCQAKAHVTIPESNGNSTNENDTITVGGDITDNGRKGGLVIDPDPKNNTKGHSIVVEANCAVVKIYGSYDNNNPSESMFQITGTASDGRPIVLFVKPDKNGRPLFLSFVATKVNSTEKICFNDSSFIMKINRGKPRVGEVICKENGVERNCTSVDLIKSKWGEKICPRVNDIDVIGNPCTPERLRAKELFLPHPNDNTKFLKCDLKGRVYVIICPKGLFYEPGRTSCGTDSNMPDSKVPVVTSNPCTHENIINSSMYFPYPNDTHYYIQCDEWGGAWLVACPDNEVWDQKIIQCVPENVSVKSPCTEEAWRKGILYFPYPPDKHKYFHCSGPNQGIIQSCGKMIYNDAIHQCLPA